MFGIGTPELLIILVIILVLFGGTKLPELSRSLGSAVREFKEGIKLDDDEKPKDRESTKAKKSTVK